MHIYIRGCCCRLRSLFEVHRGRCMNLWVLQLPVPHCESSGALNPQEINRTKCVRIGFNYFSLQENFLSCQSSSLRIFLCAVGLSQIWLHCCTISYICTLLERITHLMPQCNRKKRVLKSSGGALPLFNQDTFILNFVFSDVVSKYLYTYILQWIPSFEIRCFHRNWNIFSQSQKGGEDVKSFLFTKTVLPL